MILHTKKQRLTLHVYVVHYEPKVHHDMIIKDSCCHILRSEVHAPNVFLFKAIANILVRFCVILWILFRHETYVSHNCAGNNLDARSYAFDVLCLVLSWPCRLALFRPTQGPPCLHSASTCYFYQEKEKTKDTVNFIACIKYCHR